MTPGKLEWRESESFVYDNKQRISNKSASIKAISTHKAIKILDMLGGVLKMDVRTKVEQPSQTQIEETPSSSFPDTGSALVQCVDRFFKNPQQNYEVPLQLVQEWFSETSNHRRQELAKLFLGLLQQQGLDMQQIMGQMFEFIPNCKSNEVYVEVSNSEAKKLVMDSEPATQEEQEEETDNSAAMRDASCGEEDLSSDKNVQWIESSPETMPIVSRPSVLNPLREYPTEPSDNEENSQQESGDLMTSVSQEYPIMESKSTRSVGTSPFQEGLAAKCCSEPNITEISSNRIMNGARGMRKSQSMPSMRLSVTPSATSSFSLIEIPRKKQFIITESLPSPNNRTTNDETASEDAQPTVISSVVSQSATSYKARTTFVEMSHAEFIKRQTLLNEKVSVRQGFRLGGQILYVPELVSCSAPHVEKTKSSPPLLVHSNVDTKRVRNPVEIKLAMINNSEVLENVVVSQTSSSHTIHYTPTHNHIASTPSHSPQLINDKCSVVYVRESLPHAQPVLVAATPTATWQEEARKKPIIAYAKRKPAEQKEKQSVIFGDNMKLLIANNSIINTVHELQSTNIVTQTKIVEREQTVGIINSAVPNNGTSDVVFVKRAVEERRSAVVVVPNENVSAKASLPKFNQTFVQNFQVKPVRTVEQLTEASLEYLRKVPKKVVAPYSPVNQAGTETTVVTEENGSVSPEERVDNEESVVVEATPTVERPVQVKTVATTPAPVPAPAPSPVTALVPATPTPTPTPTAQPTQVGLLIYTQSSTSTEESSPVQTLLLTTLPNGSAYCVRLPPNANLHNVANVATPTSSVTPHIQQAGRPVVVQTVPHGTPIAVKSINKPDAIAVQPPVESNKVALLKDLKEFENVFEETKLKFEKEKQLNVGDATDSLPCTVSITSEETQVEQPQQTKTAIPKFECENVIVGVKRKSENELPVVTRLYTAAKKPLIVVANYGQTTGTQVQTRPVVTQVCNTSPPVVTHIANKSPKGKSRSGKTYPNPAKSPPTAKPQQKPQEDEKTQQKIFAILEEYAVQKEHSPDTNNRPAPRRRSNPPSASASKKKRPLLKSKDASGDSEDGSFSEM